MRLLRLQLTHVSPSAVLGFVVPFALAVLIGLLLRPHPVSMPSNATSTTSQTSSAATSGSQPTAAEVSAANAAILTYCRSDLRADTSCSLIPNSSITAPGFVKTDLSMTGQFATDGSSSRGSALAKGAGNAWSVIWVGQGCIPKNVATGNNVPASLNVCTS
ncbi:MAG TPA: hypothetical protein VLE99_05685 [Candidatus Saccharimonadales bacterium]|nr:hypothetical protein [Candidatus Saccharimonadales bacterium]